MPRRFAWVLSLFGFGLGVLAVCLIAQWWWIHSMYALASTYYQIP